MQELIELFRKTIEDKQLSNAEKKALLAILKEKDLKLQEVGVLRNQLFETAKSELRSYSAIQIVEWLEKATKILLKYEVLQQPAKYTPSSVFFSPSNHCREQIIQFLHQAEKKVEICVFTISDNLISEAIILTHKRFVDVRVITDDEKSLDKGSDIRQLFQAGVPIKTDAKPSHMHHKFVLIDDKTLITGSYNWTSSAATQNHENILINHEPNIIKGYQQEFDDLWQRFEKYTPTF